MRRTGCLCNSSIHSRNSWRLVEMVTLLAAEPTEASSGPPAANVHEAIVAVMEKIGYVQKKRKAGLNYSFAGEAALIAGIRPHMVEQGLVCYVAGISDITHEDYPTKTGGTMQF